MTLIRSDTELIGRIEADLAGIRQRLQSREPAELYGPAGYVLESVGKRLRPVLVHLTAEAFAASQSEAAPLACAVEVFHNFTLVHDDVMDNAKTRRGRPTVHEKWDVSTAILVGDLLLGVSYELLSQAPPAKVPILLRTFSKMVAALCEGQTADMRFESRSSVTLDEYLGMIDRKTGALLACCMRFGGIIGGADATTQDALGAAGLELGRAFQIQDDLLDLVATDSRWGKPVGGDLIEGKKAFLLIKALSCGEERTENWFADISVSGLDPSKVDEAREMLDAAGVLDEAAAAVRAYCRSAIALMSVLPESGAKEQVIDYISALSARQY